MEAPEQKPLHDRPEPEHAREPHENQNTLDKSGLDLKNGESVLGALQHRKSAAELLRIAHTNEEPAGEESSPLQVFGIVVGSLRRKQGLSLEEVAGRAGLPPADLFALELGELPLERVMDLLPATSRALGGKGRMLAQALMEIVLSGEE